MQPRKKKTIPKPTFFGPNLKLLRKLSGLTQTALSHELHISRNKIASYESGMIEPNAKVFLETCKYFNISSQQMLEAKLSENPVSLTVEPSDPNENYIVNQIDDFTAQTNNTNKIIEGYNEFRELKQSDDINTEKELDYILDDILTLSNTLIKLNWDLINSVYA